MNHEVQELIPTLEPADVSSLFSQLANEAGLPVSYPDWISALALYGIKQLPFEDMKKDSHRLSDEDIYEFILSTAEQALVEYKQTRQIPWQNG